MIVHQHKSMQFQAKTLGQLGRRSQEPSPIGIVQKQRSCPMPPIHHMIPRPCNVDSQCSCHACPRQNRHPFICQLFRRDPIGPHWTRCAGIRFKSKDSPGVRVVVHGEDIEPRAAGKI